MFILLYNYYGSTGVIVKLGGDVVFSYKVGLLISTTRGSCCQGLDWIHVKEGRKVVFQ